MCHTLYPLVQSALCTDVHCNKSLVWFKASSFYYTIITGPLPKLQVTDWVDVMGGQPKATDVCLGGSWTTVSREGKDQ